MNRIKIGVCLESLNLPFRQALAEAAKMGVPGVQLDAVGALSPQQLSQTGRRELRHMLRSHNVELTALGCPLHRGLDEERDVQQRLEHIRQVMTLSYDLGPRVVIVQVGKVPDAATPVEPADKGNNISPGGLMTEALRDLGGHGDRTGTMLALETGLEAGSTLKAFLDRFDSGALRVNLDPANLLLHGFSPFDSMRALNRRIVHVHAHDARQSSASRTAQEVPLGHGDIDWMLFLSVLEEINYSGYLVVERETGDKRLADVRGGVDFLRRIVGQEN